MSLVEKKLYIWVCRAVTVGKMCRGSGREMWQCLCGAVNTRACGWGMQSFVVQRQATQL
jgi:hypothetical protein